MKAMVFDVYGPPEVMRMAEVDRSEPGEGEVLVRVHATTAAYGDLTARQFAHIPPRKFNMPFLLWLPALFMFGVRRPRRRILGSELSGMVTALGPGVTRFAVGDAVMAYTGAELGCYAEYRCLPEDGMLVRKPANLSHAEAATLPYGATMAGDLLERTPIRAGERVLIVGASGGIGSMVLRLAKAAGAEVTGVCGGPRMDHVRALGADHIIDYRRADFTQGERTYDVVVDILGRGGFRTVKRILNPGGRYILTSFKLRHLLSMLWTSLFGNKKTRCILLNEDAANLESLREMAEAGQIPVVVDRTFPLAEAVKAHRYAESDARRGDVVITVVKEQ